MTVFLAIDLGLNLDVDVTVTGEMSVRRKESNMAFASAKKKWWYKHYHCFFFGVLNREFHIIWKGTRALSYKT